MSHSSKPWSRLAAVQGRTLLPVIALVALLTMACGGSDSEADRPNGAASAAAGLAASTTATIESQPPGGTSDSTSTGVTDRDVTATAESGPPELALVQVAVWEGFDRPNHIDVGPDGNVYVTEFSGGRVFKFAPDGEELARWGGPGIEPGRLQAPTGIAVDAEGFVYVAESGGHRVQKFTADGELIGGWGTRGTGEGEFASAMGIDISADGRVFVADFGNSRVQVFSTDGVFLFSFGEPGTAPGQLRNPIGLDLDVNGDVLVVDVGNSRVQKFSPEGGFLALYDDLELSDPQVISATADGGWYLSGPGDGRVAAFDADGVLVAYFPLAIIDRFGNRYPYQAPHGTATGADGAVYLADTGNNVVRKFLPAEAQAAGTPTQ